MLWIEIWQHSWENEKETDGQDIKTSWTWKGNAFVLADEREQVPGQRRRKGGSVPMQSPRNVGLN
jgi:hypothetical protein